MSEEDVIKRRLIFDGDGTGEDRRLNVMMKIISKWINTADESEEDCQVISDKILAQLALVEHSRHRSEFVRKQTEEQNAKYKALQAEMETNIRIKKREISTQKDELEQAKIIKQNRIQYDLLAKAIAKEPPRTEMNKNLKVLQKELAELASEKKQLENKLDSRKKQFNVLSTSANCLAEQLANDTKENSLGNKSKIVTVAPEAELMSE
ncbi:THO complex subunit 7 homolog [Dendroctonus ponderosae]